MPKSIIYTWVSDMKNINKNAPSTAPKELISSIQITSCYGYTWKN